MDSPNDVALVEASEMDSERLAEVAKRAYDSDVDVGAKGPGGPQGYDSPAFYTRSLKFLGCYVILVGEETVGGVMVNVSGAHGVVERIFVDPDHFRKGIGSKAMELVMAKKWGYMASLRGTEITEVPLQDAVGTLKTVDPKFYEMAKTFFG